MARIAVCSLATDEIAPIRDVTFPNHRAYCDRRGYTYFGFRSSLALERAPAWSKVLILLRTLADYDYVVWIDADAVFVDLDRDMDGFLPPADHHVTVARDWHNINTGVMVWRACPEAIRFLVDTWAIGECGPNWEQSAMIRLRPYRDELKWNEIPQHEFNSYLGNPFDLVSEAQAQIIRDSHPRWPEPLLPIRPFVIHMPGCKLETRVRILRGYTSPLPNPLLYGGEPC